VFYRQRAQPSLTHLPAAARAAASSSITATQAVAQQLGTAGHALLVPANNSFVHAMHFTSLVAAGARAGGGFVVLRWMPRRRRQGQARLGR